MISVDGILLEKKPLSSVKIQDAIRKLSVPGFRGVYVRDNLLSKPRRKECGILNLDDRTGKGTHWVAWHTTSIVTEYNRHGNWYCQYLQKPIFYNTEKIQPKGEVICGH